MSRRYYLEPLDAAAVADAPGMGRGFISVPEACELLDCPKSAFEKIVLRDGLVPHGSEFGGIRFQRYKIEALLKPLTPAEANRRMALVVIPGQGGLPHARHIDCAGPTAAGSPDRRTPT